MNDTDYFDDQILGAFVDGEVDAGNQEAIIQAMESDADLRERIYRLRRSRDLMQLGFGDATPPSSRSEQQHRRWFPFSPRLAASIAALAISFGAGMLSHLYFLGQPVTAGQKLATSSQLQSDTDNVILHISESDPMKFIRALEYARDFLESHEENGGRIEVVANAGGIDLLRSDISPVAEEVIEIIRNHDNVQFVACANAIRMLRRKGIEPTFIEGTHADETAMDYVIRRISEGGWRYIKVDSLPEV